MVYTFQAAYERWNMEVIDTNFIVVYELID